MEEIKEIFESLSARIRSPFFGYVFFFTILLNWKAWFYLLFANISVIGRFEYFENETTTSSLVYIPLGFALIATIISPWIRLFFIRTAKAPTTQRNILQVQSESEILVEKNRLEKLRIESQTIEEESIISQAERDAKVKAIEDGETRDSVQKELEELRNTINSDKEKSTVQKRAQEEDFTKYLDSGKLTDFIDEQEMILTQDSFDPKKVLDCSAAKAFGLVDQHGAHVKLTNKGRDFFKWLFLQ